MKRQMRSFYRNLQKVQIGLHVTFPRCPNIIPESHTDMLSLLVQRWPPGFEAVLQKFEQWLLERLHQKPGFVAHCRLEKKYRRTVGSAQDSFQVEAINKLNKLWHDSEKPLPSKLLQELLRDGFFWTEYLEDWLLSNAANLEHVPQNPVVRPGRHRLG